MRISLLILALAFALHAEDAKPLAAVEELQAKVAEQQKESAAKDQTIAYLQRKLQMYQQGLFVCQDAQIDAQAKSKALPPANSGASQAAPVSGTHQ